MLILTHPNTNRRHGAPKTWDEGRDGPCATLPTVSVGVIHTSYWQPEPHELDALLRGGSIVFSVIADQHPVISMGVDEWPKQLHDSDGHPISGPHDTGA